MAIFSKLIKSPDIVVAASNTRDKSLADFICPATDVQTFINDKVLGAVPSGGGKILFLEGTYTLSSANDPIEILNDNLTISGQGKSTHLTVSGANSTLLSNAGADNLVVEDMRLNNAGAGGYFVVAAGGGFPMTLRNCWVEQASGEYPVSMPGTITGCTITSTSGYGLATGDDSIVTRNNITVTAGSGRGITAGIRDVIYGNHITVNSTSDGILDGNVTTEGYNSITGNIISGGRYGIHVQGVNSTITGNIIYRPVQHGICIESTGTANLITGNTIREPSYGNNNTYDVFYILGSYNNITGNKAYGGTPKHYFHFVSGAVNNVVIDNNFNGCTYGTAALDDPTMQNRYSIMERTRMISLVAADTDRYVVNADLTSATPYTCTVAIQPDFGRNITMEVTDANVSISQIRVAVSGTTYTGKLNTEQFHFSSFKGGSLKRATGYFPFMTIKSIIVHSVAGANSGDQLDVGCGLSVGFLGSVAQSGDFVRYKVNDVIQSTPTPNYTYMTFPVTVSGPTDTYEVFYKRNRNYW